MRLAEVPVVPVDGTSEYPSVCVLMKLWDILTAESLSFPDVTAEVQTLLKRLAKKTGLDECFNRELWPEFCFFARIKPDKTLLPVRAFYNGVTQNISNNFLSSDKEIWVAGPDLVAHVIRTGNAPRILEAIRVVPRGKQKGMRPVKFRGQIEIDPYQHDMFKRVIELRKSPTTSKDDAYALKSFANAMYGFFAEVNPENVRPVHVKVFSGSKSYITQHKMERVEKHGRWYTPYLSSLITAGGRLCLGLIEECVTRAGSTYLYADTDALGICASARGGALDHVPGCKEAGVKALTWKQVDEITDKFERLNPYDKEIVPNLRFLNLTDDNYTDKTKTQRRSLLGMSISAKRYVLYERNGETITIINPKAHGLGYLYQPADSPDDWHDDHEAPNWIFDTWEYLLRKVLGLNPISLPWLKYPLMMRETVTTCNLLKDLSHVRDNEEFPFDGFRPFNFFMRPMLRKDGVNVDCFESLVAPLETDARKWPTVRCYDTNIDSDRSYRISTNIMDAAIPIPVVKDFETMLGEYLRHPEAKSLGPNGEPCTGRTRGLLQRMHVIAGEIIPIGKETPRGLEEGDEPNEVMEFQTLRYDRNKPAKELAKPSEHLIRQIKKIGIRPLVRFGRSERILEKICRREQVRSEVLRSYEQEIQKYKSSLELHQ